MKERIQRRFTSHVSRLTNRAGFTLIELAIVLVVIGIIIGAILKGQDLIEGARHKKFVNEVKKWEVATWAYLDRKGRFPGDSEKNGIIGDGTEDPKTDFTESGLTGAPGGNEIMVGGSVFYMFIGNAGVTPTKRNLLAICKNTDCSGAFGDDYKYAETLDTTLDEGDGGAVGSVRGTTTTIATVTNTQWEVDSDAAITASAFASATKAILYYFDKRP